MNEKELKNNEYNNTEKVIRAEKREFFSGPVPPPEIIEKYEKILPGAAERIFMSWEKQTQHRQNIENDIVKTDNLKSILGVIFGFIIVLCAIIGGLIAAVNGYSLFGGGISFAGLAILATAFITSRKRKDK